MKLFLCGSLVVFGDHYRFGLCLLSDCYSLPVFPHRKNFSECYILTTLLPAATNLLCFTIVIATSEDPAFAAISKQPFPPLLHSIKLAPQSKSRRTIAAWPCPQATCNALSPSVSWRSTQALKSSRVLAHCRLFF